MRFAGSSWMTVALAVFVACSSSRSSDDGDGSRKSKAPDASPELALASVAAIRGACAAIDADGREALAQRAAEAPRFREAMAATLEARGGAFHFSLPDGPANAVAPLRAALGELGDHAIPDADYAIDAFDEAVEQFRASASAAAERRDALASEPGWRILEPLVRQDVDPTLAQVEKLEDDDRLEGLSLPRLEALQAAATADCIAQGQFAAARIALEFVAMEAFFRYAMDMKFQVRAQPFKAHATVGAAVRANQEGLVAAFDAFARDPQAGLDALVPNHPNYRATMAGLARYRRIAADGGFKQLNVRGTLKRGSRGAGVQALAERLAQEGYWDGPLPNLFGEDVEAAVKAYQVTHGFNEEGVVEARHVRSLNVPIETRIQQIELSLQRWRESEVRHDEPTYVRVNLPEFMMEVWTDGTLARKHKIVCGNNRWDTDPDAGIEGRLNRTKLFTANIENIVINPRWHVPARIRKLELDFELLDDPAYYQKNNFVVKTLPDGREVIYQDAGDDNALGRVKFVFPNPFGIFMHDTNLKKFFDREIRAFSHGCIRLQDPFEVANLLLERANGITPDQIQAMKAKEEPRDIRLGTPVPIFIEYNSVGVDADGRMLFFADHYGYDRDYFDGKIPYSKEELELLQRKIRKVD